MAIARLEKPHCGNSGVPFMNRTMSFLPTISAMRGLASLTGHLRWHCGLELQCVKLSPHSIPKRRIHSLMLLDAAHPFEAPADHAGRVMVAIAGKIANADLSVGNRRLDQPVDVGGGHGHQLLLASMICRRA